jgi:predicted dehydrogenase
MAKKEDVTRRRFMRDAAAVTAGAALASKARTARADVYKSILPQTVIGANEKILTGHIGLGGMGKRNLEFVVRRDDMQPIAVCDLLPLHREHGVDITSAKHPAPSSHVYHEEVIANKDVDAVVIVTPDHWHAIMTMMACDAGKDVWCEKPLTTSIAEGQPIIDAVRRNNTVLQCGNFQRSGAHFQEVVEMISGGHIGQVARVETWIHDGMKIDGIGSPPDGDPPEGVDWDRYLGWTEKVPFNKNRYLYNFRWFLEYSGGKMTDWGAHLIDIVLWAMGEDKSVRSVSASGGNYVLQDNRTTPDTLEVLYEFDDYILSFSNRVYNGFVERNRYGIMFYGTLGTMYVDRKGYKIMSQRANGGCEEKEITGVVEGNMNKAHWQNFVDCVRSRKDPISSVESAFNTALVCHMGTTAYVAEGKLEWDEKKQRFAGRDRKAAKAANKWAFRDYENGWMLKAPYYKNWA